MKLRYNIATHKKINRVKYTLSFLTLAIFALAFITVGITSLNNTRDRFQLEKKLLREYEEKIEKRNRNEENLKIQIDNIKNQWAKTISFVNSLIERKTFPYLARYDFIEERIPEGAFVTRIRLTTENKSAIQFNVSSISKEKLIEAYRVFLKYDLAIQAETQSEGLEKASLEIKIKDEKK